MPRRRDERGIALLITILSLVVVGALVSGFFMSAILENRAGQNSRKVEQAFAAAEFGVTETIAKWDVVTWNVLPAMGVDSVAGASAGGSGRYDGAVRRLNNELFLVDVTGYSGTGQARQRIGAIVKLRSILFDVEAALTTRGPGTIGGNAGLNGTDNVPPGWDATCPPAGKAKAGLRVPNEDDIKWTGNCKGTACVTGDPKVYEDPFIDDDTFFDYGDGDWEALKSLANKRIPSGSFQNLAPSLDGGGDCNISDQKNWGDPLNPTGPCGSYYPVIYVDGDITLNTGMGQGLLLVEGDLSAQGGFEFYGIVVVRGSLKSAGNGNKFVGGVLAANVQLDDNTLIGTVGLNYSACAVARAQQAASAGSPLRSRGWVQLF
ncbi:MAG: hypothetical protein JSW43_02785 [Gemmatimonadota bacterium]|nr:MAG: hypothetical protein JSW43_02785 [Gemmatimonadota bacterium]